MASESSFYRILKSEGQLKHRGRARQRRKATKPNAHVAYGPNQVWSWDITFLPSRVKGQFFYLYLVQDLYSRFGVVWEVHEKECGQLASELVQKAMFREQCYLNPPVLHSDNGAAMKSQTLLAKLYDLGITPSRSRPSVSDDNAYVESMFRTLKYCPIWPSQGFASLDEARSWVQQFMRWYNHEHKHSQIRFVTPAERHHGKDTKILGQRKEVYAAARERHPERWSGPQRNWEPVGPVALNPNNSQQHILEVKTA